MRFLRITGGALMTLFSLGTSAFAQRGNETVTVRGNGTSCAVAPSATLTAATLATFESGATVAVLDSSMLGSSGAQTLSEALAARLPGVSVMRSSGVLGLGSRVRMRGESGVLQTRQPVLVIDGQRAEGELESSALPSDGAAPSRLDDLARGSQSLSHGPHGAHWRGVQSSRA